ncbi:MAG: hypothetical protein HYX68_07195 [Planctomycetes bacterium]|nr:hypothetical protein [Planctomycetota bacterium]
MIESTSVLCPFCNAILPALAASPREDRVPCPRCGEAVPAGRWRVDPAAGQVRAGPPPAPNPGSETAGVPGTRKTAFIVLGTMLVMATLAASYALWTTQLRRSRDPRPILDPIKYRRPLELPGMGYLPKDADIVIGLQIAECLNDAEVGKPLLDEPRPAGLDWVVKQTTRMTGTDLKDLDHILVAASLDVKSPQLTMIVRTRRIIALEKIADARPAKSSLYQDLPLYEFNLNPVAAALVWCVDKKTAICVVRLDAATSVHLAGLSQTPRPVEQILAEPLRDVLKQRLAKYQFAWAVGRLDRLAGLTDLLAFLPVAKAPFKMLQGVRTFGLGLEPIEGLTMNGHFLMRDAKAAEAFQKKLAKVTIAGAASQKVIPPPPAPAEPWVSWQLRGDAAALRGWANPHAGDEK